MVVIALIIISSFMFRDMSGIINHVLTLDVSPPIHADKVLHSLTSQAQAAVSIFSGMGSYSSQLWSLG